MRKLKSKSTYLYKKKHSIPSEVKLSLWSQSYNKSAIPSDAKLKASIEYVKNNHIKHHIPDCNITEACL